MMVDAMAIAGWRNGEPEGSEGTSAGRGFLSPFNVRLQVNCLDEFIRVARPGGHICLMFRHDGYPAYQAKVESLMSLGKWELVHKSESMKNFSSTESNAAATVMYNIWTFRKC